MRNQNSTKGTKRGKAPVPQGDDAPYTLDNSLIGWNCARLPPMPGFKADAAIVAPWPDTSGHTNPYDMTSGACYDVQHLSPLEKQRFVLLIYLNMTAREGVNSELAYDTLWQIQEFRDAVRSYDVVTGWVWP